MKKSIFCFWAAVLAVLCFAMAATAATDCATIQSGTIISSTGGFLTTGYDEFGYNYEAHMFNGKYNDYQRGKPVPEPNDSDLMMKWNDAWLSNKDCDGNHLLDRHFGYDTYKGSGAWLTNHMSGKVEWPAGSGRYKTWTYSCKIVAPPADAVSEGGFWKTAEGIVIGPVIWGSFAVTEEVSNDPSSGAHGKLYKSPAGPGLGLYGKEGD